MIKDFIKAVCNTYKQINIENVKRQKELWNKRVKLANQLPGIIDVLLPKIPKSHLNNVNKVYDLFKYGVTQMDRNWNLGLISYYEMIVTIFNDYIKLMEDSYSRRNYEHVNKLYNEVIDKTNEIQKNIEIEI